MKFVVSALLAFWSISGEAFVHQTTSTPAFSSRLQSTVTATDAETSAATNSDWFAGKSLNEELSAEGYKAQILQLGAALDRGQAYNPTSGAYYGGTMRIAGDKVRDFLQKYGTDDKIPTAGDLASIQGEWELVFTTVPHGIFRSSPFFLAVQEAFTYAEDNKAFGQDKANLFFKLHELQTCSWGVSKVGRVAQRIDPVSKYIYSEFDTSIFSLTVIPILGWFKLLPTFGGCVITASKCEMVEGGKLEMEVDYTTSSPVPGLFGLGEWIWSVKVPVGVVWKLLPWNKGRKPTCSVNVRYVDNDFRIVEDLDGELFVYTRPVVPRSLPARALVEIKTSSETSSEQ